MGPMIKTNMLQYTRVDIGIVKLRFCVVKNEVLVVDSFIDELKVGLQYSQSILDAKGFPDPANIIVMIHAN
jgi:hypothetical protein